MLEKAASLLDQSLAPGSSDGSFYGSRYYNAAEAQKGGGSGYGRYERPSSHADVLVTLLANHFPLTTVLDVGCARGFVVEALGELGISASGCDFSEYAINTAARGARGHLRWADLSQRLPWADGAFELVTCFETLEHLPPELSAHAVSELARVSRGHVVASIPSFGPRPPLPSGWFDGKMRDAQVNAAYVAKGPEYDGPVPLADLAVDDRGNPLEGHLTIASFRRWREVFERAGWCGARRSRRRSTPRRRSSTWPGSSTSTCSRSRAWRSSRSPTRRCGSGRARCSSRAGHSARTVSWPSPRPSPPRGEGDRISRAPPARRTPRAS